MVGTRFILGSILCISLISSLWIGVQPAQASCGSVTCFVVIGSQQQVSPAGVLTINGFYNYTRQGTLLNGTDGVIPAVNVDNRQMILGHHRELRTISQTYTMDFNYGVTDRLGIEVAVPYSRRKHQHIDGLGEANNGDGDLTRFSDNGIGDIFINAKYNVLPSLSSMLIAGFGVYLPTGDWKQKTAGLDGAETMEPTAQLGRGQFGLQGSFYQTYELIPHRLSQFSSGSYRHTFRNNFGYQFGDQFDFNFGASLVPFESASWLVLINQFNYRYMVHDSFSGSLARSQNPSDPTFPGEAIPIDDNIRNRAVPTTGSTYFAYSPGFQLGLGELVKSPITEGASMYFYAQIPVARDFNGNLAQSTSFIFGLTKSFQLIKPS